MRLITFFSFAVVAVVSQASLLPQSEPYKSLNARQSPASSSACESTCAPFQSSLNTCTTTTCLCTTTVAASLQSCVTCAITASPVDSVLSAAQTLRDTFQTTCSNSGLPSVTLPASGSTAAQAGGASTAGGQSVFTASSAAALGSVATVGIFDANTASQSPARQSAGATGTTISAGPLVSASKVPTSSATRACLAKGFVVVAGIAAGIALLA